MDLRFLTEGILNLCVLKCMLVMFNKLYYRILFVCSTKKFELRCLRKDEPFPILWATCDVPGRPNWFCIDITDPSNRLLWNKSKKKRSLSFVSLSWQVMRLEYANTARTTPAHCWVLQRNHVSKHEFAPPPHLKLQTPATAASFHALTARNMPLLEKLLVAYLVEKLSNNYGTQNRITVQFYVLRQWLRRLKSSGL